MPLDQRHDYLNISPGLAHPDPPMLLAGRLQLTANGPLYSLPGYSPYGPDLCTTLLPSPDGRYVVYAVTSRNWTNLMLLDARDGRRSLFRRHACDAAWGEQDEIAYVHEVRPDTSQGIDSFSGRIFVQHGVSSHATVWTRTADWTELVWAGKSLLAVDQGQDAPFGRLDIAKGAGLLTTVSAVKPYAGPFLSVVAVSPTGQEVLLDDQRMTSGGGRDFARLVRIRDGRTMSLLRFSGPPAGFGIAQGSWMHDQVIASTGYFNGGSTNFPAALSQFSITGGRIRLDWTKFFIENGYQLLGQDAASAGQPQYLSTDGHEVGVWFSAGHGYELRYARCDTVSGRCAATHNLEPQPLNASIFGLTVSNPSRPL